MRSIWFSMLAALLSSLLATGAVYLLVQQDFFLPVSMLAWPRRQGLVWARFFAATWVLAVTGTVVLAFLQLPGLITSPGSLVALWQQVGGTRKTVIALELVMALWVAFEGIRLWAQLEKARKRSRAFADVLSGRLREGKVDEMLRLARHDKDKYLGREIIHRARSRKSGMPLVEIRGRSGPKLDLGSLAAVALLAPFIGLLGTVIGTFVGFARLAGTNLVDLTKLREGIARALTTTGVGLLVAISGVFIFKYLTGLMGRFDQEVHASADQIVASISND